MEHTISSVRKRLAKVPKPFLSTKNSFLTNTSAIR